MKRLFDFSASLIGLLVLAPVVLVIAAAIRIGSKGPALFRQERVGRFFEPFTILKFRTMTTLTGAESGRFDAGDQSRVTSIGRLLRATKLDEIPQLWNVIKGEMSLVGPRPEVAKWVTHDNPQWHIVLSVRPGITDPAAIEFSNEEQLLAGANDPESMYREQILPRKLQLYVDYIQNRSLITDLLVILRTFRKLMGQ